MVVVNWGEICEIEILRMIDEYYTNQDYTVEWTHGKSELGADLVCTKEDETIVVLAKKRPRQEHLGQVSVAKTNYPDAHYEYFYVDRPSGNFLSVMRNDHQDVHLNNENSTEILMFESSNKHIFRFLVKYSTPIVRIAKVIRKIFSLGSSEQTTEFSPTTSVYDDVLSFHEGVLQVREIVGSAVAEGRRILDLYAEYQTDESQAKEASARALEVFNAYLERLEASTSKMSGVLNSNEGFLFRRMYGYEVWGTTASDHFSPTHLDRGDWSILSNNNEKRHLLKILHHLTSWCEPQPYGVSEAIGCFLSVEEYLRFVKRGSENLMRTVFQIALGS